MGFQEDYIFWTLAHYFISDQEYRMIQLSKGQDELWLEKLEHKEAKVIRLLKYNLDWSNWMQRDIENTAQKAESVRRQLGRKELPIFNIYITAFPPVDDYEFRISAPFKAEKGKASVQTLIIDSSNPESIDKIQAIFHDPLTLPAGEYTETDADAVKHAALSKAVNKAKKEKALFNFGKPFFTYMFVFIQLAMFLFLEWKGGSTDTSTLIKYGAKFNPLILEGEWWRFFTPIVLHIGLLHLLMNTLALYYLGSAVERVYGNLRFIFIYILAGFGGTLASFIFSPALSAGASGAIFGCFGALLYFGLIYPKLFFRTMGFNILVVLAINLAFGFTIPGIDNAGHIGGLIGGFLATGIAHFPKKKKIWLQLLFLAITVSLAVGLLKYGFSEPGNLMNEQTAVVMAQEYIKTEDYKKAHSLLADFIKEKEASAEVYFLLSYAEIKEGDLQNAKEHLKQVIKQKADFHEAHYNLALIYIEEENRTKAKQHAQKAADLNPGQEEYHQLLDQIADWETSGQQ
ncbi:rhomboid family intramembrane serine protease [Bacillus sp. ISL-47]|uniref:rhomboid family protein n=1 Tax=Bacillus sp. ISL-47 TaxID=2819130 RepID=UPI001BE4EBD5|nr:rhomboid family intramembrane serine protease [Bacillus sp. ISL-47]MBT2687135.1 rhomboid family intramembrane serine protease [Bacillus sp. ISL-47]MBT2710485.1 rhomboid family intramembrane serine protease [Pseudomonas sp. ISL-84]